MPLHQTFVAVHSKLRETGSFRTAKHDTGCARRVRDPEMKQEVLRHFRKNATTSTRAAANVLQVTVRCGISRSEYAGLKC